VIWPFKRKRLELNAPVIKIGGIYTSADKLGLGKTGRHGNLGREFLVAMESGKDAVFRYESFERAGTCDWDWHILKAVRYAKPDDFTLTRYS